MKNQTLLVPDACPDTTEALLQGLIAECHQIIRDVVVPNARASDDDHERRMYFDTVAQMVRVAASVGDTIGRLRGGTVEESRQRIVVERIHAIGAKSLPKE